MRYRDTQGLPAAQADSRDKNQWIERGAISGWPSLEDETLARGQRPRYREIIIPFIERTRTPHNLHCSGHGPEDHDPGERMRAEATTHRFEGPVGTIPPGASLERRP